jgi:hypothetical protein
MFQHRSIHSNNAPGEQKTFASEKNAGFSPFKKIKGGALYIAILTSIIIGIILTFFILIARYNQRQVTVFAQSSQLIYNLKSAFQIAQSAYFVPGQNFTWMKNQENDDSIRIKKMHWGAYLIVGAETKNRHQYLSQAGLYGTSMSADTGLMVSDNSRPVGLSGNIIFKANCYLPRAGIKPVYIEGQSYISSADNSSYIKQSPASVPKIHPDILKGLKQEMDAVNVALDSVVGTLPNNYTQAFTLKTIVWEISSTHLSHLHLRNNIKLVCENIEIDSTAHFENILIVCKKARFKKGFKGQVHIIASDSISMEEQCEFNYPSSFVLFAREDNVSGFSHIQFNKDCTFFGGILAIAENAGHAASQKVFIQLHRGCEINGFIYSDNYIHMEGMINATVIADKLMLKTSSAVYENHMLGCEVNPKKYAGLLAVPLLFKKTGKLLCCEMLN